MPGEWVGTALGRNNTPIDPNKVKALRSFKKVAKNATSIEGLEELQKKFSDLIAIANTEPVVAALSDWGRYIRDAGKRNLQSVLQAPPETGNLMRSMFYDARNPFNGGKDADIGPSIIAGINHNIAPHWHWMELGTTHQRARPFWRPAIVQGGSYGPPRIMRALREVINAAAGGRPARVLLKPRREPAKFSWK